MPGRSVHLGLNSVNPAHYGSPLRLGGCHNDARDMEAIAQAAGYRTLLLLDDEATAANVIEAIGEAARVLRPGDSFLLTYAGHGAQVPDESGDEADSLDETWVLFDRMLLDDELYVAMAAFARGVRILFVSDSCHSGSIARAMMYRQLAESSVVTPHYAGSAPVYRTPDEPFFGKRVWDEHAEQYEALVRDTPPNPRALVEAAVIQLSGCQDSQLSADGPGNGLFTSKLKAVWSDGRFHGSHRAFWQRIGKTMPPTQSPGYLTYGKDVATFEKECPFTISPVATVTTTGGGVMNAQQSDEGNWAEVRAELKRRFPAWDFPDVGASAHSGGNGGTHPAGNGGVRPTGNGGAHPAGNVAGSVMGPMQAPRQASSAAARAATGAPVIRTYWWGMQIEISSQDLRTFTGVADPVNAFIGSIGPMTGPAAPYITAAAVFIAGALEVLKQQDHGNGVYITMSWFAPFVFIPSPIPPGRGLATRGPSLPEGPAGTTRGPGDAYEQAGEPALRSYGGGLFGLRLEEWFYWNLPDGTVRESVIVNQNPPGFGNIYFAQWLSDDPTVGHFRLHVGVAPFQGGQVELRMMIRDAEGRRSVTKLVPAPRPVTTAEL